MTSCNALLLPFFKKHILEIIYLTQLKNDVFVKNYCFLFIHIFNTFLKNVFQKIY